MYHAACLNLINNSKVARKPTISPRPLSSHPSPSSYLPLRCLGAHERSAFDATDIGIVRSLVLRATRTAGLPRRTEKVTFLFIFPTRQV